MRKYTDQRFERKIENKSNENGTQSAPVGLSRIDQLHMYILTNAFFLS